MVKIPENLEEWSLGTITDILHEGYEESESLELKKDPFSENERIGKVACAFANTKGGIIIIGIDPERKKDLHERIIGLDESDQLKRTIVDQLKNVRPT